VNEGSGGTILAPYRGVREGGGEWRDWRAVGSDGEKIGRRDEGGSKRIVGWERIGEKGKRKVKSRKER